MDYLLAKVSSNIRVILSEVSVFDDVIVTEEKAYNNEYKLQEGEWFCIERFSEQPYFPNFPFRDFNALEYADIIREEYDKIRWFISVQDEGSIFYFQRVLSKARIIQRKGLRWSDGHPEMIEMENVLTINPEPDATYYLNEDKLLFKDISRIRPIFNGVEILYREATNEEVVGFLNLDIINLIDGFDSNKVSVPNRRRISNAITQYNAFSDDGKRTLNAYMIEYCPEIVDQATSKVQVGSDDHLKKFIYAIDQRYYMTPINNQKRVATSIENL